MKISPRELNLKEALPEIPAFNGQAEFELIRVDELDIDEGYQRKVSLRGAAAIRKIVLGFSWPRFGALVVSECDGAYFVIDGQHRAIAACCLKIEQVPAIVVRANQATQASDFVGINSVRTGVTPIDRFRARVVSGDASAIELAEMLTNLGINTDLPAGTSLGPKDTRAISKLEQLIKRFGKGTLFTTLEMLTEAQPMTPNLLTARLVEAAVLAVDAVLQANADITGLDQVFEEIEPETFKSDTAHLVKIVGGKTVDHGAKLLLKAYNKGRSKSRVDFK